MNEKDYEKLCIEYPFLRVLSQDHFEIEFWMCAKYVNLKSAKTVANLDFILMEPCANMLEKKISHSELELIHNELLTTTIFDSISSGSISFHKPPPNAPQFLLNPDFKYSFQIMLHSFLKPALSKRIPVGMLSLSECGYSSKTVEHVRQNPTIESIIRLILEGSFTFFKWLPLINNQQ